MLRTRAERLIRICACSSLRHRGSAQIWDKIHDRLARLPDSQTTWHSTFVHWNLFTGYRTYPSYLVNQVHFIMSTPASKSACVNESGRSGVQRDDRRTGVARRSLRRRDRNSNSKSKQPYVCLEAYARAIDREPRASLTVTLPLDVYVCANSALPRGRDPDPCSEWSRIGALSGRR